MGQGDKPSMNTAWSKPTKYIAGVGLVLLGIFVLYLSRSVIPLLIIAALIAVIVRSVIEWLYCEFSLPRGVAIAVSGRFLTKYKGLTKFLVLQFEPLLWNVLFDFL